MEATGICDLTIADLSKRIAGGDLSPVEVTEAHLARIDALNPVVNAFTTVAHERARAEAKMAERKSLLAESEGRCTACPSG